jgi:hypothetical protein
LLETIFVVLARMLTNARAECPYHEQAAMISSRLAPTSSSQARSLRLAAFGGVALVRVAVVVFGEVGGATSGAYSKSAPLCLEGKTGDAVAFRPTALPPETQDLRAPLILQKCPVTAKFVQKFVQSMEVPLRGGIPSL